MNWEVMSKFQWFLGSIRRGRNMSIAIRKFLIYSLYNVEFL